MQPFFLLPNDGLVAQRRTGGTAGVTLVPDLATGLPRPTDGGKTYTFTVRRGVHYSTGVEVHPEDIKRGLQRTLGFPQAHPSYYFAIIGAQNCAEHPARCDLSSGVVPDDATRRITFHLRVPDPNFLYKLSVFVYATAPGVGLGEATQPLPATGPYMISSFTPTTPRQQLTLSRNPYLRQWSFAAKPDGYRDQIRWVRQKDPKVWVPDIVAGRADVADPHSTSLPTKVAEELALSHPDLLHSDNATAIRYEWLNTRVPPFDDRRVRQALNYAVDRTTLTQPTGGPTRGTATCQLVPPNFTGYEPYCPYTREPAGSTTARTWARPADWWPSPGLSAPRSRSGVRSIPETSRSACSRAQARRLWTTVGHMITDDAPWVAQVVTKFNSLVSPRVGNYQSHPVLGPLLDQLWVR